MDKLNIRDKFKIQNMSIVQFMVYLTILAIIIATILALVVTGIMGYLQDQVWEGYLRDYEIAEGIFTKARLTELEIEDTFVLNILKTIEVIMLVIIYISAIVGEAIIVYRMKIKKPLELLVSASDKISDNDINFEIPSIGNDEMGKLCTAFEKMRASLENNYKQIWNQIEDRKKINSAFSHDLRTPLTVLKGYMELLIKYVPEDKLSKDKLVDTVKTMNSHVNRLENYVDNMSMLLRLEDIIISPQVIELHSLAMQIDKTGQILLKDKEIAYCFNNNIVNRNTGKIDNDIVLEVYDNLISNAAKFAINKVECNVYMMNDYLVLEVSDDGVGFSQDELAKVVQPFYKGDNNREKDGFGLGLNICNILCHKHGGQLNIANNENKGAIVKAQFYTN